MKRIIAIALVGGLLGGLGFAPATAKKKKPKPKAKPKPVAVDVNYYMRRADCGGDDDAISLSVVDGPDGGSGCGSAFAGAPNELFIQGGDSPSSYVWPAIDGIPLTLNTAKDITGEITVHSFSGAPTLPAPPYTSAGQATLVVNLTGTTGGESKVIGTASNSYLVTPDKGTYTTEFKMTPDKALEKAVFTELQLETYVRGTTALHGFFELDDPASFITVPTWAKKKK